jgi:hypothetical protein
MKSLSAILAAAFVAAVVTFVFAPGTSVSAGPMAKAVSEQMHACADRPWPYLRCVGTRYGNPHIRLVTTDNLSNK